MTRITLFFLLLGGFRRLNVAEEIGRDSTRTLRRFDFLQDDWCDPVKCCYRHKSSERDVESAFKLHDPWSRTIVMRNTFFGIYVACTFGDTPLRSMTTTFMIKRSKL